MKLWKAFIVIFILVLLCGNSLFAQVSHETKIVIIRQLHYNDLTYSYKPSGFNQFMDYLNIENTDIHNKLIPYNQKIQNKNLGAIIGVAGAITAGVGTGATIGIFRYTNPENPEDEPDVFSDLAFPTLMGAAIGSAVGGLLYFLFSPKDDDYNLFVNTHNSLNTVKLEVY